MISDIPEQRVVWKDGKAQRAPVTTRGGRFVKGPIPFDWITTAFQLPGKAGAVGIACWYLAGLTKNLKIRLSNKIAEQFGVSKDSKARALKVLTQAGLIRVNQAPGRAVLVEILTANDAT